MWACAWTEKPGLDACECIPFPLGLAIPICSFTMKHCTHQVGTRALAHDGYKSQMGIPKKYLHTRLCRSPKDSWLWCHSLGVEVQRGDVTVCIRSSWMSKGPSQSQVGRVSLPADNGGNYGTAGSVQGGGSLDSNCPPSSAVGSPGHWASMHQQRIQGCYPASYAD